MDQYYCTFYCQNNNLLFLTKLHVSVCTTMGVRNLKLSEMP